MEMEEVEQQDSQQPHSVVAVGSDLQAATAKPEDFRSGDRVLYVPMHAHGDTKHPDCERGVVTSTNSVNVFVRYGNRVQSQATSPSDLIHLSAMRIDHA
jgi:hypothetical protein